MAFSPSMGGIGGLGRSSSVSGVSQPMNTDALIAHLVDMTPDQRKQFASMHADDPMMLSAAKYVDNKIKQQANLSMAQQNGAPPPVNQQAVAGMAGTPQPPQAPQPPQMAQGLPENTGIGALPAPNMQKMAGGGIVAFGDGGDIEGYARGGNAGSDPFGAALIQEGVRDPRQVAFLRAIYGQESGAGKNTKTSNQGAVGGMQIKPDTFNSVADADMDIKDPVDNARGGIRYALQGYQAANGNPELAAAYYYGGPKGMQKAAKGIATSDPKNPNAPTTLGYGKQVARRMAALLPIGSAQAESLPPPTGQTAQTPATEGSSASGLASLLGGLGGAATGAYEALTPSFKPGTTMSQAARRTAATAGPVGAVGTGGGILSGISANYLSKLSPEQLEALQNDVGSDTGLAAAIMNPANRGPEVTAKQMPYLEQMKNVAKAAVFHPDTFKGAATQPEAPALANAGTSGSPPITAGPDVEEQGPPVSAMNKPEAQVAAPATPAKNPSEWTADDWLALAAGLGQNKSQYFSEAVGSGLGSLVANRAARRKYEMENLLNTAHANQLNALTEAYGPRSELAQARAAALANAPEQAQAKMALNAAENRLRAAIMQQKALSPISPTYAIDSATIQAEIASATRDITALQSGAQGATMPSVPAAPALPPGVTVSKVGG